MYVVITPEMKQTSELARQAEINAMWKNLPATQAYIANM